MFVWEKLPVTSCDTVGMYICLWSAQQLPLNLTSMFETRSILLLAWDHTLSMYTTRLQFSNLSIPYWAPAGVHASAWTINRLISWFSIQIWLSLIVRTNQMITGSTWVSSRGSHPHLITQNLHSMGSILYFPSPWNVKGLYRHHITSIGWLLILVMWEWFPVTPT